MGLEASTYLDGLNVAWPLGTDAKSQGDDHIRLLKNVLINTFGAIAAADPFIKHDGTIAMTAALNMNTQLINGVVDPVSAQDAATKAYVDTGGVFLATGDELLCRLFTHTVIPAGFTIGTTANKAVKIIGNAAAIADGGTNTFDTALVNAVSSSAAGAHTHTYSGTTSVYSGLLVGALSNQSWDLNGQTHSHTFSGTTSGASATHQHTTTLAVQHREFHTLVKV